MSSGPIPPKPTSHTFPASPKTFYKRAHFKVEDFRVDPDLGDPTEDQTLQLLGMAGVRTSSSFSKYRVPFNESGSGTGIVLFDGGRISRFHPSNDTPFSLALSFATREYSLTIIFSTFIAATVRRGDRTTQCLR